MPSSATTALYTLSLHDALPICAGSCATDTRPPACRNRRRGLPAALSSRRAPVAASAPACRSSRVRENRGCTPRHPRRGRKYDNIRSEEHTSELQSQSNLVCRLLRPPRSTLFPYTTLFRSARDLARQILGLRLAEIGDEGFQPLSRLAERLWQRQRRLAVHLAFAKTAGAHRATLAAAGNMIILDRKSTRLNSSHSQISYAVFCDHRALHSFPTRRSSDLRGILRDRYSASGLPK